MVVNGNMNSLSPHTCAICGADVTPPRWTVSTMVIAIRVYAFTLGVAISVVRGTLVIIYRTEHNKTQHNTHKIDIIKLPT